MEEKGPGARTVPSQKLRLTIINYKEDFAGKYKTMTNLYPEGNQVYQCSLVTYMCVCIVLAYSEF